MRVFAPIARVSRRHLGAAALSLSSVALASCDLNPNVEACSLTIAPTNISVTVNGRQPVVGTAFDCKGNSIRNKKISYSTASPSIATVSEDGSVIGIGVGQTTVSANANGKSATAQVTVTPELVTSVTINPPAITLRVGNTRTFTTQLRLPSGALVTKPIRWASSNSTIASVDANGVVTALAPGQVQIQAEADQVVGASTVTVTLVPIGSCTIAAPARVAVGQQVQASVVVRDTAGGLLTGRAINWTSTNEIIAVVGPSGVITGRSAGTANITGSTVESPGANCNTIPIEAFNVPVDKILITPRTGSLRIGIPRLLNAAVLDSANNVLSRPVTWTSLTPGIASITTLGLVTGNALGTARIEARSEGKADTVQFTVTQIPVGNITVNPLQSTVFEGQIATFTATVRDSTGTTVTDRPVQWLTSDPARATVLTPIGQSTTVRAISQGNAIITATSEGQGAQAQLFIQLVPVDTVIAPATFTVVRNNTSGFTITLRDANGVEVRNRVVLAVSEQPSIASVPQFIQTTTVTVTGIAVGETNIKLRAVNPTTGQAEGKETTVRILVTLPPTGGGAIRSSGNP